MPYIKENQRKNFDESIEYIVDMIEIPGEFNYVISSIANGLLKKKGERYVNYESIVGTLMCVLLEFYRKRASKYEDQKESDNGTIWE